jgi:6-phosphogluconolactonase (cycloisomerase 2 family)
LNLREGAGPRHLAFHPTQPWVYVVNELDNTVTACNFDAQTGALPAFQIMPTLADTFTGNSRSAEIEVHPAGHTLYASNRGEDSIAVFSIDQITGRLAPPRTEPSGGKTPRFFTTDPGGCWLFILNEESDQIVRLAVGADGAIAPTGSSWSCGSPVCMVFSPLG